MPVDRRCVVPPPGRATQRSRYAVAALFLVNGFTYTNVVPWLPAIKGELDLSNTALGTAVAAMPCGALLTGMLAGPLIARFGSGRAAVASAVVAVWMLPLVATAPSWWVLAAALLVMGAADAWMDAAMNAHGVRVQRRYGRTIINTFHAVWSLAAVGGGLLGAAMAGTDVPILAHLTGVSVLLTALTALASRFLLDGPEHAERGDGTTRPGGAPPWPPVRTLGLLVALSVLLMMAGAVEDSAASWGAVYMRGELAAPPFLAGLPFVAFQAAMTVGRITGDRLTDRFGAVALARSGAVVAATGLGVALLLPGTVTTIAGFAAMGMGVATLFPLTLAAAAEAPGVRSGDGVTVVGWLGRAGFLAFPPLVGVIADATSLATGLWALVVAAIAAALLVSALRPRGSGTSHVAS